LREGALRFERRTPVYETVEEQIPMTIYLSVPMRGAQPISQASLA